MQMLEQMGWREGQGLGADGAGPSVPLAAWKLNQGTRQARCCLIELGACYMGKPDSLLPSKWQHSLCLRLILPCN